MKVSSMKTRLALALVIPFAFAACDGNGMGPPTFGSVSAQVGDGAGSSASAAGPQRAAEGSFSGEVNGDARVEIFSEDLGWIELGSGTQLELSMQSEDDATIHSDASIRSATYTRVRLVLQGGSARVEAGADLGDFQLSADVTMTLGGGDGVVEIDKEVSPFTISADASTQIVFDLNSETWVTESTVLGQVVSDGAIQSAATVTVG